MKEKIENKSHKTIERIEIINENIKAHKKNLKLLHSFAINHINLNTPPYAPRIIKYTCIPKSEQRYRSTAKNLTDQIFLLEKELATLIEYGA